MSTVHTRLLCFATLALFACAREKDDIPGSHHRSPRKVTPMSQGADGIRTTQKCLYTLSITKGDSYFRAPGVKVWDFQPTFKAAAPPRGATGIAAVSTFSLEGAPLMYVDPATKSAVVNGAAFTELKRVDAPRLQGKSEIMGRALPALLAHYNREKLTRFLLLSQMIQTYYHISATVCAVANSRKDGGRTITFKASHLYFTNRRNVDHYGFSVTIAADGTITVTGLR